MSIFILRWKKSADRSLHRFLFPSICFIHAQTCFFCDVQIQIQTCTVHKGKGSRATRKEKNNANRSFSIVVSGSAAMFELEHVGATSRSAGAMATAYPR